MLYHGDCIEVMEHLLNQNIKVDHIISDIPYNIGIAKWDNNFNTEEVIKLCSKIIKPNGNIIIFQGWSNVCETKQYLDKYFKIQDWIIYDRIKGRGGKKHLVSTREDILWYSNGDNYTFNKNSVYNRKENRRTGTKEWL